MSLTYLLLLLLFLTYNCQTISAAKRRLKNKIGKGKYFKKLNYGDKLKNKRRPRKSEDYYNKEYHYYKGSINKKGSEYHYPKKMYTKGKGYYGSLHKGKGYHYHQSPTPTQSPRDEITDIPTVFNSEPQLSPTPMPTPKPTPTPLPLQQPRRKVINMKGTSIGERLGFPPGTSDLQLLCFNNLPLYDLNSNTTIGIGSNCISFMTTNNDTVRLDIISETTTFTLDDNCDTNFTFVLVPNIVPIQKGPTGFVVSTIGEQGINYLWNVNDCFFSNDTDVSVKLSGFIIVDAINSTFTFDYIYVIDLNDTA